MRIYDITRPISASTTVWPGDALPELAWSARIEEGSSVNIGLIRMSTHTATHVDAPLHYKTGGHPIDAYPIELFIGEALLIDASGREAVSPEDVAAVPPGTERLLVRTGHSDAGDDEWRDEITFFTPDTITELAARGVRLVGTDAPSFDPVDSSDLPAHHMLAHHRIANLENLQLADVPLGVYRLIALPPKLKGMDAAPVRAVLIAE